MMGLFTWIKRLWEPDDENDYLEDYDEPQVMARIRPDSLTDRSDKDFSMDSGSASVQSNTSQ